MSNGKQYTLVKNDRDLIWLEFEVVINAPDDDNLPETALGRGVLIRQQIALYADANAATNAQIIADVGTNLIKQAVVVRSRIIELDENGYEIPVITTSDKVH